MERLLGYIFKLKSKVHSVSLEEDTEKYMGICSFLIKNEEQNKETGEIVYVKTVGENKVKMIEEMWRRNEDFSENTFCTVLTSRILLIFCTFKNNMFLHYQ